MTEGQNILDNLIYGRVDPHIYAFETCTLPDYLKVGDTYRPVKVRLDEWRRKYTNLVERYEHIAKVDDDTYFRDYSVHSYLRDHGFQQIDSKLYPNDSIEFFKYVKPDNVDEAINDIQKSFNDHDNRYSFYSVESGLPNPEQHYERTEDWKPRENQKKVISNFMCAIQKGRKNLLMYAVMRFGKSFTALCCAKKMDAKLVVIVCGKADVEDEWRQNVEKPKIFDGYEFVNARKMNDYPNAISELLNSGKRVVVFLTLQDLLGDDIKEKHADLFNLNDKGKLDLLIIDETHFAARSAQTGKVLKDSGAGDFDGEKNDEVDIEDIKGATKHFAPKVRLHLSGTPYRILLGGEFSREDIIAFVQYSDIANDKAKWDLEHPDDDEWKNPYYGFPQMIRFAFNLNRSSIERLKAMEKAGVTYRLNHLLEPVSTKREKGHDIFKYEQEVLELLQAIDGCKADSNIFSFLDYDRIQRGQMCHNIVMVLPFRASCDAMQKMIENNKFNHLGDYQIINISGFDAPKKYTNQNRITNIKNDITRFEEEGKKTITLTVGRMLTGSTVREWDTMIYLRDTSSPQIYDQAIFRLQSQYINTIKDNKGDIIKRDMKPQTLLVDFDPTRMFVLENQKSLISNVNKDIRGNENLEQKLQRELQVSPIIRINKDKLGIVEPTDIVNEVREYSANRSVLDETFDVEVDPAMFADMDVRSVLEDQPEMDNNGGVFTASPTKTGDGDGDDIDIPQTPTNLPDDNHKEHQKEGQAANDDKSLAKRLRTYYFKLMLFAYLSDKTEKTLNDIIEHMEKDTDGRRIGRNLEMKVEDLILLRDKLNPLILNELENKINNIDTLGNDPEADVETALRKFGKISKSEIVTPANIATQMIDMLPEDVTADSRFLDIAAKEGEFAYAILKRYGEKVKGNVYSIPTSGVTYECTRKIYSLLGMPIEHVISDFTSYQMIEPDKKVEIMNKLKNMNFDVVVGNPPYQEENKGKGNGSDPIYYKFIDAGREISIQGTMIHPARFLFNAGKTPKPWNLKFLNDSHVKVVSYWADSTKVFQNNVTITGGVVVTYWNGKEYSTPIRFFSAYQELKSIYSKVRNKTEESFSKIVGARELYGLTETLYKEHPEMEGRQSKGHKYSLGANIFDIFPELFSDENNWPGSGYSLILGRKNNNRCLMWFKSDYITHPNNYLHYKVIISKADGAAGVIGNPIPARILGKIDILKPYTAYTDTFIGIGNFETLEEAESCRKYIMTRFARTMLGTIKVTQDNSKNLWLNVPLQDFTSSSDIDWSVSIADIDSQLYKKYELDPSEIDFIERTIKPME